MPSTVNTLRGISSLDTYEVKSAGATVSRRLRDRFADYVNAKDYGATGDGTTDDTAAITAAVNAAISTGVKRVFFPATSSFYRLSSGLSFGGTAGPGASANTDSYNDDVELFGASRRTTLKWDASFAGSCIFIDGSGVTVKRRRWSFRNLTLETQNTANKAIHIRRGLNCIIDSCNILGLYSAGTHCGIYLDFGTTEGDWATSDWAAGTRITNNVILGWKMGISGNYGTYLNRFLAVVVTGNYIGGSSAIAGSIGIDAGGGEWQIIGNSDIEGFDYGIKAGDRATIIGNRFEDIATMDITPRVAWPTAAATHGVTAFGNQHSAAAKSYSTTFSSGFSPYANFLCGGITATYQNEVGVKNHWEANDVDGGSGNFGGPRIRFFTYAHLTDPAGLIGAYSGSSPNNTNAFSESLTKPEVNLAAYANPLKIGTVGPGTYRFGLLSKATEIAAVDFQSFLAGSPGALIRHASGASSGPTGGVWARGDRYYYTDVSAGGVEGKVCVTAGAWAGGAWAGSTAYYAGDLVSNDGGKIYRCITSGTSASSGGPTGTSTDITDSSAHWEYVAAAAPTFKTFGSIAS